MYFCSVIVVLWMMGKHCISPVFDPADHHRCLNSLHTAQSYSDGFSLLLFFCTVNPLYSKKKKRAGYVSIWQSLHNARHSDPGLVAGRNRRGSACRS